LYSIKKSKRPGHILSIASVKTFPLLCLSSISTRINRINNIMYF
jgi:hypothetical protein